MNFSFILSQKVFILLYIKMIQQLFRVQLSNTFLQMDDYIVSLGIVELDELLYTNKFRINKFIFNILI